VRPSKETEGTQKQVALRSETNDAQVQTTNLYKGCERRVKSRTSSREGNTSILACLALAASVVAVSGDYYAEHCNKEPVLEEDTDEDSGFNVTLTLGGLSLIVTLVVTIATGFQSCRRRQNKATQNFAALAPFWEMSNVDLKRVAKTMRVNPDQLKSELVRQLVWTSVFGPTAQTSISAAFNAGKVEWQSRIATGVPSTAQQRP
jgi:hypothetical protein